LNTTTDAATASSSSASAAAMPPRARTVLPWALVVVLSLAFGVIWFSTSMQLAAKDAQLQQKVAEVSALREQYNKVVEEANARLKSLTDEANQKLHVASQPEVEVQAGFRKALLHAGNVLLLKSIATAPIAITAEIERPSTGLKKVAELTLDPGQVKEIGEREGWAFVAGDMVRISRPEHKGVQFTAP
jgi:uncharacterized phage infection (PIP) family protein YhgE